MIALIKAFHIAALVVWCAALLALPVLLGLHQQAQKHRSAAQQELQYYQFRRLSHHTYTKLATPAAVLAIAAGTALIFAAQVFEVWLLAKLAAVAGMSLAHAWLGHLIVQSGERPMGWKMPWPGWAWVIALPCMALVLWLVLAKPDLSRALHLLPDWMREPLALDMQNWLTQWLATWWQGAKAPQEMSP